MWQVVGGGPSSYLLNLHVSALGGGELKEASSAALFLLGVPVPAPLQRLILSHPEPPRHKAASLLSRPRSLRQRQRDARAQP